MRSLFRLAALVCALLSTVSCSEQSEEQQAQSKPTPETVAPKASTPDAEAIATNNRGVGLMGSFKYEEALAVFKGLVERYPHWQDVVINLAIATLNRNQEGDDKAALAIVDTVLVEDPANLRADYVAGLLQLYIDTPDKAVDHFQRVLRGDPGDAYAAYYLGQCLAQLGRHEEAVDWYRRAMERDPYLRSAYYGAFQALQRLKRPAEARELIGDYQRLAKNPRGRLAEFKYTRMGSKAEALALNLAIPAPPAPVRGEVFAAAVALPIAGAGQPAWRQADSRPASITAVDLQGDGRLDLFLAGAVDDQAAPNRVLTGLEDGGFQVQADHPLSRVTEVNAALWGDYDNDGLTDVYLCRQGPNQLWRQVEAGRWEDVTAATGTAGGEADTLDGALFDADHDGDLDIFLVNADGPDELLNNNRDGSFRPLAAEQGIAGDGGASRGILPVDLDGDRDVDLIVINAEGPHEVYLNDRLWAYHAAAGFDEFSHSPALAALAGDRNADGTMEIYTVAPEGHVLRWHPDGEGTYRSQSVGEIEVGAGGWAQLALVDVNGDGSQDLVASSSAGWRVFGEGWARPMFSADLPDGMAGSAPVLLDSAAGPSMLALADGPNLWVPGPGRHPYLALSPSGAEDPGNAMRSNASGIGVRLSLRVDSRWTVQETYRGSSGPGQSLQPWAFGLVGTPRADFVAMDWSDGVFQTELGLDAGKLHRVAETQRQLSSCPVLFAWDGEKYAFVSDLLGVGGIGFALGRGEYSTPRPRENFLLPEGLLKARDGRYRLKVGEPMEEVAYLDAARLVSYDLPPGWQMVLDERMGTGLPDPTGEPRYFRREALPVRAVNERGEDVTDSILTADGKAAPVGELDQRFIGRLAGEHVLELEFSESLDAPRGQPMLVIDGWVEYPYSQTMFAAWQAGAAYEPASVEAQGADGQWPTVLNQFGYPAGMPRRMSVPLGSLPPPTTRLRLRTNMEVYWDRVAVAWAEPPPPAKREQLALAGARMFKSGYPLRTTHAQRRPYYDYAQRAPFWDTRYMDGFYTRLGPVDELLAQTDDAVAIIGAGEELHLEFAASEQALPVGWSRRHVLETNGWAKDMDLFTLDGETVGPLPGTGKPGGRRDLLHARYNSRFQAGH